MASSRSSCLRTKPPLPPSPRSLSPLSPLPLLLLVSRAALAAAAAEASCDARDQRQACGDVVADRGSFQASDGATIGYRVRRRAAAGGVAAAAAAAAAPATAAAGDRGREAGAATAVLIAPALTGTAAGFTEWFAPLLQEPAVGLLVAIDWRGYGLSVGPWAAAAPPDGPEAPSYGGLSTWRLAQDLHELIGHLQLSGGGKKLVLLGHSLGANVVLQLLDLHGTKDLSGLVLLDQSPRNMDFSGGLVVDPSFPSHTVTFQPETLRQWLPKYIAYNASTDSNREAGSMSLADLRGPWQPYLHLNGALLEQFRTPAGERDASPAAERLFAQTESALLAWMRRLGPSNGKVFALLMVSSMQQDLTGVAAKVRAAGLPFLWYGAEKGLPDVEAIRWSARAMAPCDPAGSARETRLAHGSLTSFCDDGRGAGPAYRLLELDGDAGNHCPWLNEDGSAEIFMGAVRSFAARA